MLKPSQNKQCVDYLYYLETLRTILLFVYARLYVNMCKILRNNMFYMRKERNFDKQRKNG